MPAEIDPHISIHRVAMPSAVASPVDVTETSFGAVGAAIVIMGWSSTASNPSPTGSSMSIGFWDGTNTRCAFSSGDNQVGTTVTGRGTATTRIAVAMTGSQTLSADYTISAITDGVRFTMVQDSTDKNRYATVILFQGSNTLASVGSATMPDGGWTSVSGLLFKPSIVFWSCSGLAASSWSVTTQHIMSFGAHTSQNGMKNRGLFWFDQTAQGSTRTGSWISDTYNAGQYYSDTMNWGGAGLYISDDGFGTEIYNTPSSDCAHYLALKMPNLNISIQDISTPIVTGTQVFTGLGFTPEHVIACVSPCTTYDTHTGGVSVSIGASDGTTESCISVHSQDATGTSNCGTIAREQLIDLRRISTSGELITATLDSLDSDGFTLDYTVTHGASYKGFALAFSTTENVKLIHTAANSYWLVQ